MKKSFFILYFLFFLTSSYFVTAQQRGVNDTIKTQAIMVDGIKMPFVWLRNITIVGPASDELRAYRLEQQQKQFEYQRLRYNVYKTYPYAVAAAFYSHDIDSVMNTFTNGGDRRRYKRQKEHELNERYKEELKNFTISEGQVLVKLIARQTGKPCYEIIKDFKGGINARIAQIGAQLFDNNLKNNYDPLGEDSTIENIVQEIERTGHFERSK